MGAQAERRDATARVNQIEARVFIRRFSGRSAVASMRKHGSGG